MSSATQSLPKREIVPPNYVHRLQQAGLQFKQANPKEKFLDDFTTFQKNAAEFQTEATKYLYDNPDAGDHEYRVHCHFLAALIADGQGLIVTALCLGLPGLEAEKLFLQNKVDSYIACLNDWHGAPGSHSDEPASFRAAVKDYANGKLEEGDL